MPDRVPKPLLDYPLISNWISFDLSGRVTVRSGRVELGQGAVNAITQMAAHELFVAIDQIDMLSGDTQLVPNEGYTVGSYSVSEGGTSVQLAAAAARHVIVTYVSKLLQSKPSEITIKAGHIYRDGAETDLNYWNLPDFPNLDREVLTHTQRTIITNETLIGTSGPPNDLLSRLAGSAFIHDLSLPGLLHARVVLPLMIGQPFDVDKEVVSNIEKKGSTVIQNNGYIAVVDTREERASKAAGILKNSISVASTTALYSDDMIAALDELPSEQSVMYEQRESSSGMASSTVSVSIARPCIAHASIGPSCGVALFNGNLLTVWTHSQGVFHLRSALAGVLELDEKNVRVIHVPGAGCYGHNGADDAACDAAIAAMQMTGSPIRLIYNREDEFSATTLGPAMRTEASAGLDKGGNIISLDMTVISPPHSSRPRSRSIPNLRSAALLRTPTNRAAQPRYDYADVPMADGGGAERNAVPGYDIANITVLKKSVVPPYRGSSLRSLGSYVNVLAIESVVDECARELQADPLVFRVAHISDIRGRSVLERVAQAAQCDLMAPGVGIAYAQYKNQAAYCACIAKVTVVEDVCVDRLWIAVDTGQVINPSGVRAQIEGGAIQAISWLLCEEISFADGLISTHNWEDYPILTFNSVPPISVDLIDSDAPPLGCGEAATGPVAAAVLNAASSELGIRPTRTPLTRDNLIQSMTEAEHL
ncbi:MAG: molybdopterin cofactor-binding domain-containing protein [Granulosicoccus sp.]